MFGRNSSGIVAVVVMLAVMFIVDPAYQYLRRKLNPDYPRYQTPTKTFRVLAFLIPLLTALSAVLFLPWPDAWPALAFSLMLFAVSCIMGRYFLDRSRGRTAFLIGPKTVEPDNPDFANDLWDLLAIAIGAMLVLLPAVLALRD